MPLDAVCCERASEHTKKELIAKIIRILKTYLRNNKNSKDTIDVIKELIYVGAEFNELLDIYHDPLSN